MKQLRKLLVFSLCVALTACITLPKTVEQFKAGSPGNLVFVAEASLQKSYELISKETIRCHQGNSSQTAMIGSSFVVFPSGKTRVEGKIDSQSALVQVRFDNMAANGLLQVVELNKIAEGATEVVVHKLNDTKKWRTASENIKSWFSGGTGCYKLI